MTEKKLDRQADAEKGLWLENNTDQPDGLVICSKCGHKVHINFIEMNDYCPNCGAFNYLVRL